MGIEAGQQWLHYRLTEKIGEGGMGVVWKARDTSLDRDVAIKILPRDFASDPGRLARFEREARLLATLNHPKIAAIYGLHEAPAEDGEPGLRFIAMELIDGPTLAEQLEGPGLPFRETLQICGQIAEALEAAHDSGIVHRDLKPANVKVRPDGTVKVLDFGLARDLSAGGSGSDGDPDSPTATDATHPGTVLGTAPYMSPEQARGKPVDKRTDIWALGCVLYECLVGRRPFEGDSMADVLAQIASRQPDFERLPPAMPGFVARLLRRCLEKDSKRRLRDAGEMRVAFETFQSNPDSELLGPSPVAGSVALPQRRLLPWALVAILVAGLAYVLIGRSGSDSAAPLVSRWNIPVPAGSRVALPSPGGGFDYSRTVAISRDGTSIAFSVAGAEDQTELYFKKEAFEPRSIPETSNGRAPFFSPDSAWLAYYDTDDNGIYKVALGGGAPQQLCEIPRTLSFDASWSPDGDTIVYATDDGLWRLPASGGTPARMTRPDADRGELIHYAPRFAVDGASVLFTVATIEESSLATMGLEESSWKVIVANASMGVPVAGDRIVIARAGELLAASYDPADREVAGSWVPVVQDVDTAPGTGGVVLTQFDLSDNGTLVYVPAESRRPSEQLLWVGLDGRETVIASGAGQWVHPRLSPDGTRVSLDIHSPDGMRDIHIYELERGQFRQLTRTGMSWESEWRPDGERLAFLSGAPAGQWSLFWVPTDFSGDEELLFQSRHAIPASWTPDGKSLLFSAWVEGGIWQLEPDGDREPRLLLDTEAREGFPRLSPDGNWIAFAETESGRREVFVQSFPDLGAKHKISIDGGGEAVWARDGSRLFFRHAMRMYEVEVAYEPEIRFSTPRLLFIGEYDSASVGHQHFDISLENDRFLMVKHGKPEGPNEVRVVLNWSEELRTP